MVPEKETAKGGKQSTSKKGGTCKEPKSSESCINCKIYGTTCSKEKSSCSECRAKTLECEYPRRLRWLHSSDVHNGEIFVPPKLEKKRRTNAAVHQEPKLLEVPQIKRELEKIVSIYGRSNLDDNDEFDVDNDDEDDNDNDNEGNQPKETPSKISSISTLSPLARDIMNKNPLMLAVFDYYLNFTCSAIDPLNGTSSNNLSKRLYLPLALTSLSAFNGVLAISACQLGVIHPEFTAIGLHHREKSYQHLYELISKNSTYDIELLASILCQVTIDITEPQAYGWLNHLRVYRQLLKDTPILPIEQYGECAWYVSIRMLKYDTFGCIQTGTKPLISHRELIGYDSVADTLNRQWACPAIATVVCAEISYCYMGLGEIEPQYFYAILGLFETSLKKRCKKAPQGHTEDGAPDIWPKFLYENSQNLWGMLEDLWMLSTLLYFRRSLLCLPPTSEKVTALTLKMLTIIEHVPKDNFLAASLVWPVWLLVSVVYEKDQQDILYKFMDEAGYSLCLQSFYEIMKLARRYWGEDTRDSSHEDYMFFVRQSNWNQLMA